MENLNMKRKRQSVHEEGNFGMLFVFFFLLPLFIVVGTIAL